MTLSRGISRNRYHGDWLASANPQPARSTTWRAQAGVSTATVSRVVHGQDRVRPSTRQRVLGVIEALGYVPDSAAQSMVRKRKEVIGLVAIESRRPDTDIEQEGLLFMEEVLRGVESALSQVGWSVLISIVRGADRPEAFRGCRRSPPRSTGC